MYTEYYQTNNDLRPAGLLRNGGGAARATRRLSRSQNASTQLPIFAAYQAPASRTQACG